MSVEVKKMTVLKDSKGALRAFCDITIAERITIKGCRVVEGNKGLFVAMPQNKGKDDKWYPIVWIETDKLKQEIHDSVMESYAGETGKEVTHGGDEGGSDSFPEDDV